MKTVLKVLGVPIMLTAKIIVGLCGLLIFFISFMMKMGTSFIGLIVSALSGLGTAITVFGIGLTIYHGQYEQLIGEVIILAIFTSIALLPMMSELILEGISDLGAKVIGWAFFKIPMLIEI